MRLPLLPHTYVFSDSVMSSYFSDAACAPPDVYVGALDFAYPERQPPVQPRTLIQIYRHKNPGRWRPAEDLERINLEASFSVCGLANISEKDFSRRNIVESQVPRFLRSRSVLTRLFIRQTTESGDKKIMRRRGQESYVLLHFHAFIHAVLPNPVSRQWHSKD